MICGSGAQLVGRRQLSSSATAKWFFSLFYQWSSVGCSKSTRGSRSIHSLTQRRHWRSHVIRSSILPPQRANTFFLWHPKSPVTAEIHDEEPTTSLPEVDSRVASTIQSPLVTKVQTEDAKSKNRAPALNDVSESVRHIMRHLPAPIVVLTTSQSTKSESQFHGMTLSSLTTLSLSPDPIISFNIRTNDSDPSRTLSALESSQQFLVHTLDENSDGAIIADVFTKGSDTLFKDWSVGPKKLFDVQNVVSNGTILPRLNGNGIRKVLRCEVLPSGVSMSQKAENCSQSNGVGFVRVRDHVLIIARVLEVLGEEGTETGHQSSGLSYMDGKYRHSGEIIALETTGKTRS